jgi:hypothetical protein
MRWLAVWPILGLCCFTLFAQDSLKAPESAEATATGGLTSYVLTVIELRTSKALAPNTSPEEILAQLGTARESDNLRVVETTRLSLLSGHEQMATFGKQIPVTTGTTSSPIGKQRSVQMQNTGTLIRATATPSNDQVLLQFSYEASRLTSLNQEDAPPEMSTTRVTGAHLLPIGVPKLLAGSSTDQSTFVIVSLNHQ